MYKEKKLEASLLSLLNGEVDKIQLINTRIRGYDAIRGYSKKVAVIDCYGYDSIISTMNLLKEMTFQNNIHTKFEWFETCIKRKINDKNIDS